MKAGYFFSVFAMRAPARPSAALARQGDITLLYTAKDRLHNEAVSLKRILDQRASL